MMKRQKIYLLFLFTIFGCGPEKNSSFFSTEQNDTIKLFWEFKHIKTIVDTKTEESIFLPIDSSLNSAEIDSLIPILEFYRLNYKITIDSIVLISKGYDGIYSYEDMLIYDTELRNKIQCTYCPKLLEYTNN
ncbi:hypothetical protein K6119_07050 [Paracrocinitomix mangrovi]|uniref:hypothetical protein n=1 Tax=Paracrocinitomix mangrovi TaxID=2862509 RepID=UPI001EDC5DDA|nr:hypothetical protein [Paracrocinitomix mangrovi]UKN03271.1 hypothetical protein K6119_07050 [Paracrocinitomix mangrovi]